VRIDEIARILRRIRDTSGDLLRPLGFPLGIHRLVDETLVQLFGERFPLLRGESQKLTPKGGGDRHPSILPQRFLAGRPRSGHRDV
jgi:hypothetical protein